jgi:hypothetical protein
LVYILPRNPSIMSRQTIQLKNSNIDELLPTTKSSLGQQVRRALIKNIPESKFDALFQHVVDHQTQEDEKKIPPEEMPLLKGLARAGFFNSGKQRNGKILENEVPQFHHLLKIRDLLPTDSRDGFFEPRGLGDKLYETVASAAEQNWAELHNVISGSGFRADYLRRISSILFFTPESGRTKFVSDEAPKLLKEAKTYKDFIEKTTPLAEKYLMAKAKRPE